MNLVLQILLLPISASLISGLLCGCRTTSDSHQLQDDEIQVTCDNGAELIGFTLESLDALPPPSAIDLGNARIRPIAPGGDHAIRLDVCVGESTVLKRIHYEEGPPAAPVMAQVDPSFPTPHLSSALEQDHENLNLMIPLDGAEGLSALNIRGWRHNEGSFVSVVRMYRNQPREAFRLASLEVLVGRFVVGNPFEDRRCAVGERLASSRFRLGTAVFTTEQCEFPAGGHTVGYRFLAFKVNDTNPRFSSGHEFSVTGTDIRPVLNYKYVHHNGCDSFVFKTPEAVYSATSAAIGGCGEIVEGAPRRTLADQSPTVLFSVRYGETPVEESAETCTHHLFSCPADAPVPEQAGTFSWVYSNHTWNRFTFQSARERVVIDTPQGDASNTNRNLTFGWRPLLPYNRAVYSGQGVETSVSRWLDEYPDVDPYETPLSFCEKVAYVESTFPRTFRDFLPTFRITGETIEADMMCPGLAIAQPEMARDERPMWDTVCIFSPKQATGRGPSFVGAYVPYQGTDVPPMPFLTQWPKRKSYLCVDGQISELELINAE